MARSLRRAAGVAVVLAAGLVLFGCEMLKGKGTASAVGADSFRLADADVEVRIAVAELVGSKATAGFAAELKKLPLPILPKQLAEKSPEAAVAEQLGIESADIESVTVSARAAGEAGAALVAIVTRKPIDSARVVAALSRTGGGRLVKVGAHAGVDLYAPESEADKDVLAFVGPHLAVLGGAQEVKRGIDDHKAGRTVPCEGALATAIKAAPAGSALVVAIRPTGDLLDAVPIGGGESPLADMAKKLECVSLSVRAGEAFDLTACAFAKAEPDAAELRRLASESLAQAREETLPMLGTPEMKPLKDALDGVKVAGGGKVVEIHASLRPEIVKCAMPLMGAMMMGAAGGAEEPAQEEPEGEILE